MSVYPFGWYGGKLSHLGWLLPLLPMTTHYCEPYGGSGAVLLNRPMSPLETYNDLDGDLVNFFRVLRKQPDELLRLIGLTPYSREEYILSISREPNLDAMEQARRFFVRANQSTRSKAQLFQPANWRYSRIGRRRVASLPAILRRLNLVAKRLANVQIEHDDALVVITRYDSSECLFYIDPPYAAESRIEKKGYFREMSIEDHEKLAATLQDVDGLAAISGYRCGLMDRLYRGWYRHDAPPKAAGSSAVGAIRQESLWANYDDVTYQYPLLGRIDEAAGTKSPTP